MATSAVYKPSVLVSTARKAFEFLHGTINVYKPAGVQTASVIRTIKDNLCDALNEMDADTPLPKRVQIESEDNKNYEVKLVPNLAMHVLASGPTYTYDSLRISTAHPLSTNMSGVLILGINKGANSAHRLRNGAPIQTFEVVGKFGIATQTNFGGSRVVNRATYSHVTPGKLQALVSSLQTSHQRQMFALSGVDIQTEAAYELACKGLIRPKDTKQPIIYGIRSVGRVDHSFTLEVQAMNATEQVLSNLVVDIALQLRTVAHCSKIRCKQYGFFTCEQLLLRSKWNLENVLRSMHECQKIWNANPSMVSQEVSTPVGGVYNNEF